MHSAASRYICSFFGRCLDANNATPMLPLILGHISKRARELFLFATPVLVRILRYPTVSFELHSRYIDQQSNDNVFEQLIADADYIHQIEELVLLNDVLANGKNADFGTLLCDIIQQEFFGLEQDLSEYVPALEQAVNVVKNVNKYPVRFIAAVSLIRAFFQRLSSAIESNEVSEDPSLYNSFNSLLTFDNPNVEHLRVYFLKQLRRHSSIVELRKFCSGTTTFPWMNKLEWKTTEQNGLKLNFNPFNALPGYEEAFKAFALVLTKGQIDELTKLISEAKSKPGKAKYSVTPFRNTTGAIGTRYIQSLPSSSHPRTH